MEPKGPGKERRTKKSMSEEDPTSEPEKPTPTTLLPKVERKPRGEEAIVEPHLQPIVWG